MINCELAFNDGLGFDVCGPEAVTVMGEVVRNDFGYDVLQVRNLLLFLGDLRLDRRVIIFDISIIRRHGASGRGGERGKLAGHGEYYQDIEMQDNDAREGYRVR